MPTESSSLMNSLIRRGNAPRRQENTGPSPDEVVAAVAKLVEDLPEVELELFRDQVFAVLYPEGNTAEATR